MNECPLAGRGGVTVEAGRVSSPASREWMDDVPVRVLLISTGLISQQLNNVHPVPRRRRPIRTLYAGHFKTISSNCCWYRSSV